MYGTIDHSAITILLVMLFVFVVVMLLMFRKSPMDRRVEERKEAETEEKKVQQFVHEFMTGGQKREVTISRVKP